MVLGALDLASLQAFGADVRLAYMAVLANRHLLHVGLEGAIGHTVAMADGTPGARSLAADFTNLGHVHHSFVFAYRPLLRTHLPKNSLRTIAQPRHLSNSLHISCAFGPMRYTRSLVCKCNSARAHTLQGGYS